MFENNKISENKLFFRYKKKEGWMRLHFNQIEYKKSENFKLRIFFEIQR